MHSCVAHVTSLGFLHSSSPVGHLLRAIRGWSLDLQDIVNAPDMAWYFEQLGQLGFGEPVSFWDWQALS